MPGRNGTGPTGNGPMTGGGRGFCNSNGNVGYGNGGRGGFGGGNRGCGFGRGRGFGGGFGTGFGTQSAVAPVAANEKEILKAQSEYLEQELKAIKNRLTELDATGNKE